MKITTLQKSIIYLSLILLYIPFCSIEAQVTIGSGDDASAGSLLDLKERSGSGVNSAKGLLLPRVKLVDHDKLQPMYSYTDGDTPTSQDLSAHEGLVVYNTNGCAPFGFGTYVWTGSKWTNISQLKFTLLPSETITIDTLHLPSGKDARVSGPVPLTFEWSGTSPMFEMPTSAATGNISGPIALTLPGGLTPQSGSWTSSPATLTVRADDMTNSLVTATSPWKTLQSKLNLIIPGNECGETYSKQILLNQTNYAMIAGSATSPVTSVILRNADEAQIPILSNVPWKAEVTSNSPEWAINKVLDDYTTEIRDNLSSDGTTGTDYNFVYKPASGSTATRFTSVTVTIKDPRERAKDITIDIKQCQGTPLMVDAYVAADEDENTSGSPNWSGKVVFHPAKDNVYREFVSAEFGSAGRWMITNFAASAYDGKPHSTGRSLDGPRVNNTDVYNTAYWAYPNKTDLTSSADFDQNPYLGYLYTWDAASGGKGGVTGKNNFDKNTLVTWVDDRSEAGMEEWSGTLLSTSRGHKQQRRQGICPEGWHLPSDREWTELEREIIRNTTSYANVASNIETGNGTALNAVPHVTTLYTGPDTSGPDASRGSTHGKAMKDECELNFEGTSKHPLQNGFSIQLPGFGAGAAYSFGMEGMYWTSSIAHGTGVYARKFGWNGTSYDNAVYRYRPYRYYQFSVRCKKD